MTDPTPPPRPGGPPQPPVPRWASFCLAVGLGLIVAFGARRGPHRDRCGGDDVSQPKASPTLVRLRVDILRILAEQVTYPRSDDLIGEMVNDAIRVADAFLAPPSGAHPSALDEPLAGPHPGS